MLWSPSEISQGRTQARQEVRGQTSAGLTVGTGARAGSVRGVQGAQGEDLADNLAAGTMGVEHLGYVTLRCQLPNSSP